MLDYLHYIISNNIAEDHLPAKVIQFLKTRTKRVYSHPNRGKSSSGSQDEKESLEER